MQAFVMYLIAALGVAVTLSPVLQMACDKRVRYKRRKYRRRHSSTLQNDTPTVGVESPF